jgi:threonine/homoserine/homoserine lactone efflux protein
MCLLVFNTSTTYGFWVGLSLVLAIVLIDSLYITLSGLGVAVILNKKKINRAIKWFGCVVLVFFGMNTIAGVFNLSLLPHIAFLSDVSQQNIFIQGLLLTASNPLTIIFWSGVFSAQVAENCLCKKQLILFGFGCALSSLLFLTLVAFCGSILSGFLPLLFIQILNFAVGVFLMFFGVRLLLRK